MTWTRFRKRPIEVSAFQMTAERRAAPCRWPQWLLARLVAEPEEPRPGYVYELAGALLVVTLEGVMSVKPDDWIVRGIEGELYSVRPDIFERTYEAAA